MFLVTFADGKYVVANRTCLSNPHFMHNAEREITKVSFPLNCESLKEHFHFSFAAINDPMLYEHLCAIFDALMNTFLLECLFPL